MKKALAILMTVCLLASLFVACDNNARIDELVKASFDASESRALIVSNDPFIAFNDSSIKWQYKAEKDTDPTYNVGAAATWTDIPGTTSGLLSNTIEFSQGKWNFELRAVKTADTDVVVYYGKTDNPVLLTKQTGGEKFNILINLTAQLSGQKGYIVLSNISVKHKSSGTDTFDAPSKVFIDGTELVSDKYTSTGTSISTAATGLEYTVGTHRVKVQKIGANGEILAEEEKTIEVYAGLKTTISNWVLEITQTGQFAPVAPTGTATENIPDSGDVTFKVANVTPSMVKGNDTTVTVPASNFTGSKSATISVAVKQASEASVDNSFTASSGNAVAAVIDLTLKAGETPKTEFGEENTALVVTYVAKDLAGFKFGYPGEEWTKVDTEAAVSGDKKYWYESSSGKLVFRTSHFSSFVVETSSVAVIGDTAYSTFSEALTTARDNSTVFILKNVEVSAPVFIACEKSITLDLNGKTINATLSGVAGANSVIEMDSSSLEIKDSIGTGKIISDEYAITASNGGTIIVSNGTIEAGYAVLSGNNSTGDMNFVINGGTLTSTQSEAIYMPGQQKLTITGGTINGGISARMGQINISGGEINGMTADQNADSFDDYWNYSGSAWIGDAIYVWGGTYTSANTTYRNSCNITITGGTINGNAHNAIAVYNIANNYDQNITVNIGGDAVVNGIIVKDDSKKQNTDKVVSVTWNITGGSFTDINSAVEYASEGAVIKLASDVSISKSIEFTNSITLDTNGKTIESRIITNNPNEYSRVFVVNNSALTVTITGNGSFTAPNSQTGDNSAIFNVYAGTLNIDGASLESANTAIGVLGGIVNIKNAVIKAKNGGCSGLANGTNAVINVYGVKFTCGGDDPDGPGCFWAMDGGEVNIYGGEYNAKPLINWNLPGETEDANYCLYDYRDVEKYGYQRGFINVYGGTFIDFNPASNYNGDSFVAEGYEILVNENRCEVVRKPTNSVTE